MPLSSSSTNARNTPRLNGQRASNAYIQNAENSLNRVQSHLDQASTLAEQGACSALFAHEVNNLMTQVGGRAQLAMLHRDRPELTTKALELAIHASHQIAQLAESLMSTDQSQPVSPPAAPDDNAVYASIADIHLQTLEYIAQQDISSYRLEIDDLVLAQTIQAPAVVLGQVLLNLYLNAIRAIEESDRQPTGLIAIRLLTAQAQIKCSTGNNFGSTGEHIEIVIEDTGVGMPEHLIESLADGSVNKMSSGATTDQEVDQSDTSNQRQSHPRHGYGLRISQDLLAQVGGSLAAQSTIGQGTKMTITLPIQSNSSAA